MSIETLTDLVQEAIETGVDPKTLFFKHLPEGMTEKMVLDFSKYRDSFMRAVSNASCADAIARASIEIDQGRKPVQFHNIDKIIIPGVGKLIVKSTVVTHNLDINDAVVTARAKFKCSSNLASSNSVEQILKNTSEENKIKE